jgi:hypothetical protein
VSVTPEAPRKPGWERVLDAFMATPDRTLTNVQLGDVPGVQAFHQRITDMHRYGYVVTPGVLVKKGRYAYTLVGIDGARRWEHVRPDSRAVRPHTDALPVLHDEGVVASIEDAVAEIRENAEAIAKRERAPVRPATKVAEQSRMVRDSVIHLGALLGDITAEWDEASQTDLLALVHATVHEMTQLRSLPVLIDFHTEAWARVRDALTESGEVENVADLGLADLVNAAVTQCKRPLPVTALGRRRAPAGDRGPSGPSLMRKALEHTEQPMHSAKIAAWVMANGGDALFKGKTPGASMASQLATSNKKGGEFVRVETPGCYALREWKDQTDQFGNPLLDLDPIR